MKNKLLGIAARYGIFLLLVFVTGCWRSEKRLEMGPHGIIINPTEKQEFLEGNWAKIKDKLQGHEELFHIRYYQKGEQPIDDPLHGVLPEIFMQHKIDQYDAYALQHGFEGHAIQIGLGLPDPGGDSGEIGSPPEISPTPDHGGKAPEGPSMPHPHLTLNISESKALVEELKGLVSPTPGPSP